MNQALGHLKKISLRTEVGDPWEPLEDYRMGRSSVMQMRVSAENLTGDICV